MQFSEIIHNLPIPQVFYKNILLYYIFRGKSKYLNEIHYHMEYLYEYKGP